MKGKRKTLVEIIPAWLGLIVFLAWIIFFGLLYPALVSRAWK